MKGRILIDVQQTGHKCGEYVDIDKKTADALISLGAFDPNAPWPEAMEPQPAAPRKRRGKPSEESS